MPLNSIQQICKKLYSSIRQKDSNNILHLRRKMWHRNLNAYRNSERGFSETKYYSVVIFS